MLAKILGFVALGLSGACLLFTILALALPYWQTYPLYNIITRSKTDGHQGIFRKCAYDTCVDVLENVKDGGAKSSVRATQAMVLLGFFAMIGATVVLVVHLFMFKDRKMFGYIAGGLAIVSGFFLMVGFAVYADNVKGSNADYGAGFAFDILAWLVAWAAGGIVVFMTFTGTAET